MLTGSSTSHGHLLKAFEQGLDKLGYAEGNNISLVVRFAEGSLERRDDVKQVTTRLKEWRADSLNFLDSGINLANRKLLGEFVATMRTPAVSSSRECAEAGALISYGANLEANYFRAATYVDKIFKRAKPADLPVEQPTTFEMVINMKTAKALGVKIPNSVLLRADKVIE